jgi:tetrahydromethanopterin S-methyltransferase subunit E
MCCKKKNIVPTTANILRRISVGKFDQGLYLNEKRHQSSICGGLFTVFLLIVIISYSAVVFTSVFKRYDYKIDESTVLFA